MKELTKLLQAQFEKMCATGKLFRSSLSGESVWELYLSSFKKEDDPTFRDPTSSVHNCNCCHNFVRRYGNIVAIDENNNIMTIFDVTASKEYQNSCDAISKALKEKQIANVFFESFRTLYHLLNYSRVKDTDTVFQLGYDKNFKQYTPEEVNAYPGTVKPDVIYEFNHMHLFVPKQFVSMSSESIEAVIAPYRDAKNVLKRALTEIPIDTLVLVKDLIAQGSLLDGSTHLQKVDKMIELANKASKFDKDSLAFDNWCWVVSYKNPFARFRNELIGVLCTELAEGVDLNEACTNWNKRVDPANYMKAVAPITKRQIEEAKKFVADNGYEESFNRRCATIDDIKASDILHLNVGDGKVNPVSIFDQVAPSRSTRHKRSEFNKVEEVSIEKFMQDILPTCTSVEAFLTSQHKNNMVTLTTSVNKESKPIFKWHNNFSWTYNGNLAGKSQIKEAVKAVGGVVDAVLRFSITWNEDGRDIVDLDAHAIQPDGTEIYYSNYKGRQTRMSGMLDIDMIRPRNLGVENIFWTDEHKMEDGWYRFFIHNYDGGYNKGAKAEIAYKDQVFSFVINEQITGKVDVAQVRISDGEIVDIRASKYLVSSADIQTEIYGLSTNEFYKVNLICLSPNYWTDNVGNKHYFFMLEGCKAPESIRGFHNENLKPDLLKHRKVMEVLANTLKVESTDGQLSGLGFNATVHDELILRLKGNFKRVIKVKF